MSEEQKPRRIQRRRTKGWRMPENTVYVGRGSKWGNPYRVGEAQVRMPALDGGEWERDGRLHKVSGEKNFYCIGTDASGMPFGSWHQVEYATAEQCIELYRRDLKRSFLGNGIYARIRNELAGKNLACWCAEDQPCHADVLLEIANGDQP